MFSTTFLGAAGPAERLRRSLSQQSSPPSSRLRGRRGGRSHHARLREKKLASLQEIIQQVPPFPRKSSHELRRCKQVRLARRIAKLESRLRRINRMLHWLSLRHAIAVGIISRRRNSGRRHIRGQHSRMRRLDTRARARGRGSMFTPASTEFSLGSATLPPTYVAPRPSAELSVVLADAGATYFFGSPFGWSLPSNVRLRFNPELPMAEFSDPDGERELILLLDHVTVYAEVRSPSHQRGGQPVGVWPVLTHNPTVASAALFGLRDVVWSPEPPHQWKWAFDLRPIGQLRADPAVFSALSPSGKRFLHLFDAHVQSLSRR